MWSHPKRADFPIDHLQYYRQPNQNNQEHEKTK